MRYVILLYLLGALAGCSGETATEPPPPPPDGPLVGGIVSGQNQTVRAGRDSLTQPVVVAVVRSSVTGRLVLSVVGRGGVNTQTIVNGSPVPGAVICAHPDSLHPLTPWVQCTNTDSTGHAPMWFDPGVKAGHPSAEIRGTKDGEPAVFDTVVATVLPGPAATLALGAHAVVLFTGQSYPWDSLVTGAADRYGNATATDSVQVAGDTTAASELHGLVTFALDSASAAVNVTALEDLSGKSWSYTHGCTWHNGSGQQWSTSTTLTSTAVSYAALPPLADSSALVLRIVMSGSTHYTDPFGTDSTTPVQTTLVVTQYIDSVAVRDVGTLPLVTASPRTYTDGGDDCPANGYTIDSRTPRTLTATP